MSHDTRFLCFPSDVRNNNEMSFLVFIRHAPRLIAQWLMIFGSLGMTTAVIWDNWRGKREASKTLHDTASKLKDVARGMSGNNDRLEGIIARLHDL